jgi:hypothetical protein
MGVLGEREQGWVIAYSSLAHRLYLYLDREG